MSTIKIKKNGPYIVNGDITLVGDDETTFGLGGRSVVALCGCGQSEDPPFCDGTHKRTGFECDRAGRDLPPK